MDYTRNFSPLATTRGYWSLTSVHRIHSVLMCGLTEGCQTIHSEVQLYSWSPNSCHSSAHSHPAGHLSTLVFDYPHYLLLVLLVNHTVTLCYVCVSPSELRNLRLMSVAYFIYLFLFSGLEYSLTFLVHQRFHYTRSEIIPWDDVWPSTILLLCLLKWLFELPLVATVTDRGNTYGMPFLSRLAYLQKLCVYIGLRHNCFHISQPS